MTVLLDYMLEVVIFIGVFLALNVYVYDGVGIQCGRRDRE